MCFRYKVDYILCIVLQLLIIIQVIYSYIVGNDTYTLVNVTTHILAHNQYENNGSHSTIRHILHAVNLYYDRRMTTDLTYLCS